MRYNLKPERNAAICEDRKSGMSWSKLVAKYKISATRCQYICLQEERRKKMDALMWVEPRGAP